MILFLDVEDSGCLDDDNEGGLGVRVSNYIRIGIFTIFICFLSCRTFKVYFAA